MTLACPNKAITQQSNKNIRRIKFELEGIVQGVGFRPCVNRLATRLDLTGWITNTSNGVTIDIEGESYTVKNFYNSLLKELPPLARIDNIQQQKLTPVGFHTFTIKESEADKNQTALISPDVSTCPDCLDEILDKSNRRYAYPFTNCTNCGPRFSILENMPFDRSNTTMKNFRMCDQCQSEYESINNRRYHAQANTCPDCGPQLSLWDQSGQTIADKNNALLAAVDAISEGKIVALKGIGGFQLIVDASNDEAVSRLRQRKARPHKPFALMFPTEEDIEHYCELSKQENELLNNNAAPIVLLRRREQNNNIQTLAESIAPNNPYYGVMLPYSPLHHLLMHKLGFPVIATSGNLSGDPIVIDENEALLRLNNITDYYLVHDRPIVTPLDDSVVQIVANRCLMIRRARGLAPFSLPVTNSENTILALGGHLKSTVALTIGNKAIISPHIGSLDNIYSRKQYETTINHLQQLYNTPSYLTCDQHPNYYSSHYANKKQLKTLPVQHHVAHIISCMEDNNMNESVLGVTWDGTGYGEDNTIWGGEFFVVEGSTVKRVASLRPFALPGGEKAIEEPRRAAIGLLYEVFGNDVFADETLKPLNAFTGNERKLLQHMLQQKINSPMTSSMGRLFDAVASLSGLMQTTSFEGQAAMALEFAIDKEHADRSYAFTLKQDITSDLFIIDWQPMIENIIKEIKDNVSTSIIAKTFHNTLVKMILCIAKQIGKKNIVLSGGCFQNRCLSELTIQRLKESGFKPHWHQHLPPNDGGLALGQAVWAAKQIEAGLI